MALTSPSTHLAVTRILLFFPIATSACPLAALRRTQAGAGEGAFCRLYTPPPSSFDRFFPAPVISKQHSAFHNHPVQTARQPFRTGGSPNPECSLVFDLCTVNMHRE